MSLQKDHGVCLLAANVGCRGWAAGRDPARCFWDAVVAISWKEPRCGGGVPGDPCVVWTLFRE